MLAAKIDDFCVCVDFLVFVFKAEVLKVVLFHFVLVVVFKESEI